MATSPKIEQYLKLLADTQTLRDQVGEDDPKFISALEALDEAWSGLRAVEAKEVEDSAGTVVQVDDATLEKVVTQRAAEVVYIWSQDPTFVTKNWPSAVIGDKVTVESASNALRDKIREDYKGGVCKYCRGPAMPCAERHARARSCV